MLERVSPKQRTLKMQNLKNCWVIDKRWRHIEMEQKFKKHLCSSTLGIYEVLKCHILKGMF